MFLINKKRKSDANDLRTVEGFTHFYNSYLDFVLNICFKYTKEACVAEDITAQLFTKLWERREELHQKQWDENSWKYYLTTAAKHRVFDHIRSVKRQEVHRPEIASAQDQKDNSTERDIYFGELSSLLTYHVNQLPPKCREVFQLSRYEGLTNKEIAKKLSVSDNTVKTHMANALNYLRKHLSDYALPKRSYGT
ncbi:MAG: RNA polymerase sigma-70 factor [Bacteroidota bacterium]